ncbi:sigma-54-dependent Fis family transcriptional regulator [Pseudomonas sp. MAP12]|uniref:Sigma-54-dependent Fis family transcriptional regulator n=1 Tax=Geopseudomonas aromaticivorans TaxID=2849492 RepID=A0ABS6MZI9_9GAMM|nr:sigma-54-dependent Fis family transcriptional regulator [Pseudomonas aromaticivorans]
MSLTNITKIQLKELQDLSGQIRFDTDEGKIWLGEQRVLLMQLSTLASFRREIISLIGVELAKGFFLRLGYHSGLMDAELARKIRPGMRDEEVFLAGPQLYALKGLVKVRLLTMDIDIQGGRFNVEAEWVNSFEVDICLTELGLMNEPVCWTVLGYASGYSSSFMGRKIIFQETSCRGCGDDKCLIVGKTAEEWDDISSFEAHFNSDPIVADRYELQKQVASLRSRLMRYDHQYYGIGHSPAYKRTCQAVDKAARSKVPVLLLGETGVGKEVLARSVHMRSERAKQPFVAVNCAAIPADLLESELFGVDKGAYTGAVNSRAGRFERADGGTLFLDEVIELSPKAQAALLRVLQEGEVERVGGECTRKVDVRVISATNESLEEAVKAGRFRADLFFRLNVFPVHIPPLRERVEDIPLLIEHFLEKLYKEYGKKTLGLSNLAMEACLHYQWPGNIRELGSALERGVILTESNESISVEALFPGMVMPTEGGRLSNEGRMMEDPPVNGDGLLSQIIDKGISLEDVESGLMRVAMNRCGQNISQAARLLGLTRPALAYRLKKGVGKN